MTVALTLSVIASIAALEIAWRCHLVDAFREMARTGRRARRALARRRGLEARKERCLKRLSLRMLRASLRAGERLALAIAPIAALFAANALLDLGLVAVLLDWRVHLALLILTLAYASFRFRRWRRLQPC